MHRLIIVIPADNKINKENIVLLCVYGDCSKMLSLIHLFHIHTHTHPYMRKPSLLHVVSRCIVQKKEFERKNKYFFFMTICTEHVNWLDSQSKLNEFLWNFCIRVILNGFNFSLIFQFVRVSSSSSNWLCLMVRPCATDLNKCNKSCV